MRRSKIVLSLSRSGVRSVIEILRTFLAGAALLAPDVTHLRTWPDLHIPYITYWPMKWDVSDLIESFHTLLRDEEKRRELAENGQSLYKKIWSLEGREEFCKRLYSIVDDAKTNPDKPSYNTPYVTETKE